MIKMLIDVGGNKKLIISGHINQSINQIRFI